MHQCVSGGDCQCCCKHTSCNRNLHQHVLLNCTLHSWISWSVPAWPMLNEAAVQLCDALLATDCCSTPPLLATSLHAGDETSSPRHLTSQAIAERASLHSQAMEHDGRLCVHTVLCLLKHHALGPLNHLIRDFVTSLRSTSRMQPWSLVLQQSDK